MPQRRASLHAIRSIARALSPALVFLAVAAAMVAAVLGLGRLTWWLSEAGRVSLAEVATLQPPPRDLDAAIHKVDEWPADRPRAFTQAPALAQAVASGDLPPVEDRLPEQPLVITPPHQAGPYGGIWRRYANSPADAIGAIVARVFYETPVRWSADGRHVLPNVFRHWTISDDGRTCTFHLRPGMRWSDGHRFTAHDIAFWYHHVLLNEELTPSITREMRIGGQVASFHMLDEHTFQLRFNEPAGLLIERDLTGSLGQSMLVPSHYLSRYHADFFDTDDGQPPDHVRQEMDSRGYEHWTQLYSHKDQPRNPDRPTLAAWRLVRAPPARPVVFERNPYYWKVDHQGNQLPYIDRIHVEIFDPQIINMRAIQGEVHMQFRHLRLENYPLLMKNRQRTDGRHYRVLLWRRMSGNELVLPPNLNHHDPILRQLFNNRRFRQALSYGLDRRLINEAMFFGSGQPRQVAPGADSPFHVPGADTIHTAYDPDRANALLDELGLPRGRDGVRRRPDGRPLRIRIDTTEMPNAADVATPLVAQMWSRLGIAAEVNRMNRDLFYQRKAAAMHDMAVWFGEIEDNPLIDPRWMLPFSGESNHAVSYAQWFTSDGAVGEPPSGDLAHALELYQQIERTVDPDRRLELMRRIVELNRDNLWVIGTVGRTPLPVVVSERMRNVPDVAVETWHYRTPGNTAPECYALEPR